MLQIGRNATDESSGFLKECRYVLHDRHSKFTESFRQTLTAAGVQPLKLPPRSPNLNAFAERWVRSVKHESLGKLILFGEGSLKRALAEIGQHYHAERPHQGKDNLILFPTDDETKAVTNGSVRCRERLGGLLRLSVLGNFIRVKLTTRRTSQARHNRCVITDLGSLQKMLNRFAGAGSNHRSIALSCSKQ